MDAPVSVVNSTFDEAGATGAVPYALFFDVIDGPASLSVANSTVIGGIGLCSRLDGCHHRSLDPLGRSRA